MTPTHPPCGHALSSRRRPRLTPPPNHLTAALRRRLTPRYLTPSLAPPRSRSRGAWFPRPVSAAAPRAARACDARRSRRLQRVERSHKVAERSHETQRGDRAGLASAWAASGDMQQRSQASLISLRRDKGARAPSIRPQIRLLTATMDLSMAWSVCIIATRALDLQ